MAPSTTTPSTERPAWDAATPPSGVAGGPRRSVARRPLNAIAGLAVSTRPRQWLKNVLVFTAPLAAGVLDQADALRATAYAFVAFCAVASGLYLVNDVIDRNADRAHPLKQHRPIAAGIVPPALALLVAVALGVGGLVAAAATDEPAFVVVLVAYAASTLAYGLWLKHEPVIDLAAVAAGFVLRAVGGAMAVGVNVSDWFLIVALFGSLLMVTGKRRAELEELDDAAVHRPVLGTYTSRYLDHVLAVSSGTVILAYCLWALESDQLSGGGSLEKLSVIPFTLAILCYVHRIGNGRGGAPEEVVSGDRTLLLLGAIWVGLVGVGVYVM